MTIFNNGYVVFLIWSCFALLIGIFLGWLITILIPKDWSTIKIKVWLYSIAIICWLIYYLLIVWWQLTVESRFDGTEGSGVGFGAFLIFIINAWVCSIISIISLSVQIILKKETTNDRAQQ